MCEITAHSGCDGMPDNSMEFVRYALASEGNCLEADIRRNRDGELILSHDETEEEAVRLGQVFELLKEKPEKRINCDLKTPGLEIPVYQLAKEYGVEGQLIYSGTVSSFFMKARPEKYPEVRVYWNIENLIPEPDLGRNICMKQMEQAFRTLFSPVHQYGIPSVHRQGDGAFKNHGPGRLCLDGQRSGDHPEPDGKGDRQYHHTEP